MYGPEMFLFMCHMGAAAVGSSRGPFHDQLVASRLRGSASALITHHHITFRNQSHPKIESEPYV